MALNGVLLGFECWYLFDQNVVIVKVFDGHCLNRFVLRKFRR
jgi:hypothetical protein